MIKPTIVLVGVPKGSLGKADSIRSQITAELHTPQTPIQVEITQIAPRGKPGFIELITEPSKRTTYEGAIIFKSKFDGHMTQFALEIARAHPNTPVLCHGKNCKAFESLASREKNITVIREENPKKAASKLCELMAESKKSAAEAAAAAAA